jgi:hypothetical protein
LDGRLASALTHLRQLAAHGSLILLTAIKAIEISQAVVLADLLAPRGAAASRCPAKSKPRSDPKTHCVTF